MRRYVALDFDTTGLYLKDKHRVTDVGAVEIKDFELTKNEFSSFVNPERDVPKRVQKLTGLTTAFLKDKPLFGDIQKELLDFIGDSKIVAHNARFDRGFLNAELKRLKHRTFPLSRFLCTKNMSHNHFPHLNNHKLSTVCRQFNISVKKSYRALVEARLAARVFCRFCLDFNLGDPSKLVCSHCRKDLYERSSPYF